MVILWSAPNQVHGNICLANVKYQSNHNLDNHTKNNTKFPRREGIRLIFAGTVYFNQSNNHSINQSISYEKWKNLKSTRVGESSAIFPFFFFFLVIKNWEFTTFNSQFSKKCISILEKSNTQISNKIYL